MAEINEVSKEIRRAVDTGKVFFGFKQAEKTMLSEQAELIVFSSNAPQAEKERIREFATLAGIQCFVFEGNGLELGAVCGKPFVVSFLTIKDSGKSKVLSAIKESEKPKEAKQRKQKTRKEKKQAEKEAAE